MAVADAPEGPYKDLLGKPLINEIVNGAQPIDQFVFEDNGNYYLYYGGWGHCNVVRLKDDFTGIIPFDDGEVYKEITPENYTEGSVVFKRNSKYYFMWSEGDWGQSDYCVAYAIADSPFGPFRRIGKVIEPDPEVALGAGHYSVIHISGTDDYYAVYHRRPLGYTEATARQVCIEKMEFTREGEIKPIPLTFTGVGPSKLKRSQVVK